MPSDCADYAGSACSVYSSYGDPRRRHIHLRQTQSESCGVVVPFRVVMGLMVQGRMALGFVHSNCSLNLEDAALELRSSTGGSVVTVYGNKVAVRDEVVVEEDSLVPM